MKESTQMSTLSNNNIVKHSNQTRLWVLTSMFVAMSIISAFLIIPLPVVPITFQLIVAISAGVFLGPKYGPLSQLIYLFLGLIGFPVFTKGGGPAYILQPTFGFLVGLFLAAFVSGIIWDKPRWKRILAIILGIFSVYIVGVTYLWLSSSWVFKTPISFFVSLNMGFWPFIIKDLALGVVLLVVIEIVCKYTDSR